MRVLLDTNIIIHREASKIVNLGIGQLFNWFDKLGYVKCIHPNTKSEIEKYRDINVVNTMKVKIENYYELKTTAPLNQKMRDLSNFMDKNDNDYIDTKILNELYCGRVDIIVTEDKKLHKKAKLLGIQANVYTIEGFLEKVNSENPELIDYKTLSVRKEFFGNLNLTDHFFDSFRRDYMGFDEWFNRKSDEVAYVCFEDKSLIAFLYIKQENDKEDYSDITPKLLKARRLKVGTFKVVMNGYKLGERFLKIIFDNAISQKVDEIYVTIFEKGSEQIRLIELLLSWGFVRWGIKNTTSGEEVVLIKDFRPKFDSANPRNTYPYFSVSARSFIVPIYPDYHTNLFPDSILRNESPEDFIENEPYRNAISKVYVSRSRDRSIGVGDNIIFYRTGEASPKVYTSVVSTIGVVESVITSISSEEEFIYLCRKRSVFSDVELSSQWNFSPVKPFIINFLYTYSFPKRLNLMNLIDLGILHDINSVPRGFQLISKENFGKILKATKTDESFIVN